MTTSSPSAAPWWQSLIAGGIAGTIEITITYPTEYIKTKLQLPPQTSAKLLVPPSTPFQFIQHTIANHGIRGMYVGLLPMMVGNGTKSATRFLTYATTVNYLQSHQVLPSKYIPFTSGIIAGLIEAILIVTPTESIKTMKIASSSNQYSFKVKHLWRGCVPVMMRQSCNSGIRFGSYSWLKYNLYPANHDSKMTFLRGAIAGLITVYCTMPFDTIKTRMQAPDDPLHTKNSIMNCVRSIWADGGISAFWKGSTPRLSRLIFSGAIVFTVYENVMLGFQRL